MPSADHPRGGSDDHANVVCGVLTSLSAGSTYFERICKAFDLGPPPEQQRQSIADQNLLSVYAGFHAMGR